MTDAYGLKLFGRDPNGARGWERPRASQKGYQPIRSGPN